MPSPERASPALALPFWLSVPLLLMSEALSSSDMMAFWLNTLATLLLPFIEPFRMSLKLVFAMPWIEELSISAKSSSDGL
ncbi:hypothetical protein D3C87_1677020 [compost metagenome]